MQIQINKFKRYTKSKDFWLKVIKKNVMTRFIQKKCNIQLRDSFKHFKYHFHDFSLTNVFNPLAN